MEGDALAEGRQAALHQEVLEDAGVWHEVLVAVGVESRLAAMVAGDGVLHLEVELRKEAVNHPVELVQVERLAQEFGMVDEALDFRFHGAGLLVTAPVLARRLLWLWLVELGDEGFVDCVDHLAFAFQRVAALPSPVEAEDRPRLPLAAQPELADAPVFDAEHARLVVVLHLEVVGDAVAGGSGCPAEVVAGSVFDGDLVLHVVVSVCVALVPSSSARPLIKLIFGGNPIAIAFIINYFRYFLEKSSKMVPQYKKRPKAKRFRPFQEHRSRGIILFYCRIFR